MAQITIQTAVQHHQAGRLVEAEAIYRQILSIQPNHPDALHLLGLIAGQVGRIDAALDLIGHAIAAAPRMAEFHVSLGQHLCRIGKFEEAVAAYRKAVELKPDLDAPRTQMAIALLRLGRRDEAIAEMRQVARLKPNSAEAHNNLGGALLVTFGETDEAIAEFRTAIPLKGDWADPHRNLGTALAGRASLDEALSELRRAVVLKPDAAAWQSELLMWLWYHPKYDGRAVLAEHRQWAERWAQPLAAEIRPHGNDRSPAHRLRIGYVSPDLRSHPVSAFLLPVLRHHDRKNVEVFCYANVLSPDEVTQQVRQATDVWRDTTGLSDAELTDRIRQDQIDILVDLALHSHSHRLLVFARRPAPVQVTWLGYPATTGLSTMDYRLTDPYLDPPGQEEPYSERSIRLPHCFWCYPPNAAAPGVSDPPAKQNDYVTFACFNNFAKASLEAQRLWARVLTATPHSRMLIQSPPGDHRNALLRLFETCGVAGERVEFFARVPIEEYFRLFGRVDLCLDSTPFGGGTTTFDALWMGVPVITLAGQTAVGRGGVSILSNLGLTELIGSTPAEYVAIATELAGDLPRMAALRSGLRQKMRQSPLMDIQRFTADLEAAFRQMWVDWCNPQCVAAT